jgi:hypothetical protein
MWEYKVVIKNRWLGGVEKKIEDELNELGYQGWELISAVPIAAGLGSTTSYVLIFRRQYSSKVQEIS